MAISFTPEELAAARARVEAGEDYDAVMTDIAQIAVDRVEREEWEQARLKTAAGPKLKFKFNSANRNTVLWAKKHAAELIDDITEVSRKRIRSAIAGLAEGQDWNEAIDKITKAVGDEERAEMIAAHETMLAASEGQRQAWDQAVDKGLLSGKEKREWIVTPDDKLCPDCEALEGKTAPIGGLYPGGYSGPPLHVKCRCTEGLI